MRRWIASLALLLMAGGCAAPATADQTDHRLDMLFEVLQTTHDPRQARLIEMRIWHLWTSAEDQDATALMERGTRAMETEDTDTALAVFDELVDRFPDFAEGWNKRATLHFILGNYGQSVADIQRTLELEPRHFGALSGLGLINMELDRTQPAIEAFEAALAVNPHMPGAKASIESLRRQLENSNI